jgi:hypothetical protein
MAKLSAEVLEQGRERIRAGDLDGFMAWVKEHVPFINLGTVRDTYTMVFKANDTVRGLRLFDKVFPEVDTARDLREGLVKLAFRGMVFLGALGGVIYLIQTCTGH